MKTKIYLAYGSNLNIAQMKYRCPKAKPIGTTELHGYELLFRGSHECAVATIEPKEGESVPVLLWKTTDTDEIALDHYEGFPHLYRKETVKVIFNGKEVEAYVYIMNEGRPINAPGCGYYATIREGYETFGFDVDFLKKAAQKCKRHEKVMTDTIVNQILSIRDTALTNMFDINAVKRLASMYGYVELTDFLEEHVTAYVRFILTGDIC